MARCIARWTMTTALLCSLTVLQGCSILSWIFGAQAAVVTGKQGVTAKDGPVFARGFSFQAQLDLRPCDLTTDDLGYTVACSFAFPDGTNIRSVFEFDYLTGSVVLNRYSPIILQLPQAAGVFAGTFDNGSGTSGPLHITSGLSALPIDTKTTLLAEPGTQLVIIDLPASAAVQAPGPLAARPAAITIPGPLNLRFDYRANSSQLKVMSAAKFQLGSRTFYPAVLPCVSSFGGLPPLSADTAPSSQQIAAFARPCNAKIYSLLGDNDPGPQPLTVVEFYNAALDHYFITWIPEEIAGLDAGTTARGWSRTGYTFNVYRQQGVGTSPVCRYYLPPQYGDSHFFGRGTEECNATGTRNPGFVLEQPDHMHVRLPTFGFCPADARAVYRVFSNRADANHRYTTNRAMRDQMVQRGWLAEGDGPDQVVMCGPG